MNDELRQAAEEILSYVGEKPAAVKLARARLAEHPADAETPIDDAWLRSVGGKHGIPPAGGDMWFFDFTIQDNEDDHIWLRIHEQNSDGEHPTEVYSDCKHYQEKNGVGLVGSWAKTRGALRRLCRALGIELKEGDK